jgi:hypothetical protein
VAMLRVDLSKLTGTPVTSVEPHCCYVPNVIVCREQKDGEVYDDESLFVPRTLADTGAGPSVITTELLDALPSDACVQRDYDAAVGELVGPDGKPLQTHGHATVIFWLNGLSCVHCFLVMSGKPMLLLGIDFLKGRKAVIYLNEADKSFFTLP